jgi:hypothetical protein
MHLFKTVRDFGYDFDLWETRLMLTAWAVVIAGAAYFSLWRELILYWLIPYTFIFLTLRYWAEVEDHYRVSGAKTRSDLNWFYNTFIGHNLGYHALHHKYSSIPWFHLPEAYRAHKAEIVEQVSRGYWHCADIAYTRRMTVRIANASRRQVRSGGRAVRKQSAFPRDAVETPAFIVRPAAIAASRDELARLCGLAGCRALYSLKALGLPDVLRLMVPQLAGFSASSLYEALLARRAVGPQAKVQVTSPGLRDRDCAELAGHCDAISFNSLSQSARLNDYFFGVRKGLRVNPQISWINDERYDPCRQGLEAR